jgi:uncharacterized membrane protein YciS (DUF1049 family)
MQRRADSFFRLSDLLSPTFAAYFFTEWVLCCYGIIKRVKPDIKYAPGRTKCGGKKEN